MSARSFIIFRASFETPHFGRSLRWAQISILGIRLVCLWLKSSPALSLTKLKRFEIGSSVQDFGLNNGRRYLFWKRIYYKGCELGILKIAIMALIFLALH
jgi:hypothetical protein